MTKVLIGVPCTDFMHSRMAFALLNLEGGFHITFQIGSDIAHNRNKLVVQSLDGYSHLLMIDSDMIFEPDTLERMLAHDKPILGLAANRRKLPRESVVKPLDGDITKPLPHGLFEAESVGTGVMLINTDVFRKMDAPWFEFKYMHDKEIADTRVGEDVNFCKKARALGFNIWVDSAIPVGHIGEFQY